MSKYQYALLLNDLMPHDGTKLILDEIYKKQNYDITLFLLNKERMVSCILPVFNIADYFNFNGVTIVTTAQTLQKSKHYPTKEPIIVIGNIPNEICVPNFDLDLIERTVNEYYARH